ncbi:MAG TPA: glycosyl hydrolase family 65 protein [Armatimonadota bacterium]|jgi:kojibiose phosphorylase
MSDTWSLVEPAFSVNTARAYEGLFTQGSGYLQIRGSLEEHLSDCPQDVTYTRMPTNVTSEKFPESKAKWGTYIPGLFGKHPFLCWEMLNLPSFIGLRPIVDGEALDMEHSRVDGYTRTLDLRTATLRRTVTWQTRSGAAIAVTFERFVSAHHPGVCVQRMTLACVQEQAVTVQASLDTDVRTNGYDHFTAVTLQAAGEDGITCHLETDGGDTVQMLTRVCAPSASWRYEAGARAAQRVAELRIPAGGTLIVEKRTAVATSRDLQPSDPAAVLAGIATSRYEDLHAEHAAMWAARWESADVQIEGDEASQRAMRCSLYHLLRAHVPGDSRVAIDAKGYAGDAYWGHFFWDTEIYLLPFFLYTDPERARTLVDFRVQALPEAKQIAARFGYDGARYPWQSDHAGRECCLLWQYSDHEVHVTADVAYGLVHFAQATDDPRYLFGPAAHVLVETARYWMQRIDWVPGQPHPSLLGVMGPDEYSPISHNNSYTNRLVRFALAKASEVGWQVGASAEECAAFALTGAALPTPRAQEGKLVLQCEGFDALAEPNFADMWRDRTKTFAAQVSQERLYRTKCLKQADVLMLMMLFPQEFTDAEVRCAWEYYLPYTTHDSSLSAGAHAVIACRLGLLDDAWAFWLHSTGLDLDVTHGGAAEGIHIASCGVNWQIAIYGFAGMASAMAAEHLTLRPQLPAQWSRLSFPILWKGCPVHIDISQEACTVTNRGEQELSVQVDEQHVVIPAGETVSMVMPVMAHVL